MENLSKVFGKQVFDFYFAIYYFEAILKSRILFKNKNKVKSFLWFYTWIEKFLFKKLLKTFFFVDHKTRFDWVRHYMSSHERTFKIFLTFFVTLMSDSIRTHIESISFYQTKCRTFYREMTPKRQKNNKIKNESNISAVNFRTNLISL